MSSKMKAIKIENLTKAYRLYDNPANRLKEIIFRKPLHRTFVALDGINLEAQKGETFGVIGENGAGKSTLLKIISKTTSPSKGNLEVNGRVSSLLELGAGFHPEFTGLDNIFFYGSLLGIEKGVLEEKKEEIIEFSEIGDFINYPLKTYSSGMYVRLAFSVATAVDPDILVVDEALSVGDLHFQKKSTDKILSFKEEGKTIVFCTHEMYHVARICDRVIWLKNGKIHMEGDPLDVIQEYETYQMEKNSKSDDAVADPEQFKQAAATPVVFIKNLRISPSDNVRCGSDLTINIQTHASSNDIPYRVAAKIRTAEGSDLIGIGTNGLKPLYGNKTVKLVFPELQLRAGTFIIEAFIFDEEGVYWYDRKEGSPIKIPRDSIELGIVNLPHEWIIE